MRPCPNSRRAPAEARARTTNPLEDGHYYSYGLDFERRIPSEFRTTRHDFSELFDETEFERQGLHEDYIFVCEKPLSRST